MQIVTFFAEFLFTIKCHYDIIKQELNERGARMNQILSVEMSKSKKGSYRNKSSNKADIRTIIIFFCIILILFAAIIGVIAISIMNKKESGETQQGQIISGIQPEINIEIQNETTLNIIVTHDKQLSTISYSWNDPEKVEETDIGENNKE